MFRALRALPAAQEARIEPLAGLLNWLPSLQDGKPLGNFPHGMQKQFLGCERFTDSGMERRRLQSVWEHEHWEANRAGMHWERMNGSRRWSSGKSKAPDDNKSSSDSREAGEDGVSGIHTSEGVEEGKPRRSKSGEERKGGSVEKELNMKLSDLILKRIRRRADDMKGVAKLLGSESEGSPTNIRPMMAHSSSLMWADGMLGTMVRMCALSLTWLQTWLIQRFMDETFSEEEFLEGCKDASYMVNQLFGENDWDALSEMVSEKLLVAFRDVGEEFNRQGLKFSITTEQVRESYIQGVNVCDARVLSKFDEVMAKDFLDDDDKDRFWMMIGVRLLCNERFKVWKSSSGEVISDVLHQRSDLWTFVRGPFRNIPMGREEAEASEWTLLSVS